MKKSITLLLVFVSLFAFAQKEANIWYFGDNAGLDFNPGAPVTLTNGLTHTPEGTSCISDAAGNLLFYTDGVTVWNRNHVPMPNGTGTLYGSYSSSQAALIVPKPGNPGIYYIFTTDEFGFANGLCYSEVDMSLMGGMGDVTATINVLLHTPTCEKLTAAKHANQTDIWVLSHGAIGDTLFAYLVTASGVTLSPVISNIGCVLPNTGDAEVGCMKATSNGDRVAMAHRNDTLQVLDFDRATGVFSNPITLTNFPTFQNGYSAYGVEFSPSGQVLYAAEENYTDTVFLFQYDLMAGNNAAIENSRTIVGYNFAGITSGNSFGSLQMGPDGKIYVARSDSYLGVINSPETLGIGCNYNDSGVNLLSRVSNLSLPNFIPFYFNSVQVDGTCYMDSTYFNVTNTAGLFGVQWDFDDPASGINNISYITNPAHYFAATGTYNVTVLKFYASYTDTVTVQVVINPLPLVSLGPDTSFCSGTPFEIHAGSGYGSYVWQDNSTDSVLTVTLPGTYWVTVQQNGCNGTDTIVLTGAPCNVPVVNLMSSDTIFCDKNCIDFTDLSTNNPTSWQWFFPGADSTFSTAQNPAGICYNSFGSFDVTLIACNAAGCDTLVLPEFIVEYQVPPQPVITQSQDTLYSTPAYSYSWYSTANPGVVISSNSYITTSNGGSYFVVISDSVGCQSSSTIFVSTGIMEASDEGVDISWDPVNGTVQVNLTGVKGGPVEISVWNMLGQEIYKTTTGIRTTMIDLSASRGGIYFIRVFTPQGACLKKIILEKSGQ